MKMTYDYLPGTQIYLHQRKDMFRMNTDTALLGNFMKVKEDETVLDIGTNNGALLLYASQYTKGKLIGIDIQQEACNLAIQNLKNQNIENFEVICSDIADVQMDSVDVIVCNPPYFRVNNNQQLNENEYKNSHEFDIHLLSN